MKNYPQRLAGILMFLCFNMTHAEVEVVVEHNNEGPGFEFTSVPPPANNDAATTAVVALVEGERDRNGGQVTVLTDGRVPTGEDQPAANFFFRAGTDGGRVQLDLGSVIAVKQVSTYSWHANTRAPQVYRLYAARGGTDGFEPTPKRGIDPESCGWALVASVDTRRDQGGEGGQYGVMVFDPVAGVLGNYQYLLLDVSRTEERDPFGNTFYNEIDVIDSNGPVPTTAVVAVGKPILQSFATEDGKYHFAIDSTMAPDLTEWADQELRPVVLEWYPKLVAMLSSEGFVAATNITLRFRDDMGGTPASAGGNRINLNTGWFRSELNREARGSVVHEMVHVVQAYGRAPRTNPNAARTPGWLVEGIADYVRWFLYEPETKGAEITRGNIERARYDSSYRVTGNFLEWVTRERDPDIVQKLNAAAREGRYSETLWTDSAGKTVQELGDEWRTANEARINANN